jgi:hypothetical protein
VRQRGIECQYDGAIEAGGGQKPQLGGLVGQPEQRFAGMEKGARMRLKCQRRRRLAESPRAVQCGADDGAMAAVHAIEIAHGDHGAAQRCGVVAIAHDEEIFRRHGPGMVNKSRELGGVAATAKSSRLTRSSTRAASVPGRLAGDARGTALPHCGE